MPVDVTVSGFGTREAVVFAVPSNDVERTFGPATTNDHGAFATDITLDPVNFSNAEVTDLVAIGEHGSMASTALLVVETPVTSPIKTWAVPVDRGSKHELEMIGVRNPLQSAKRATLS